jgi:hypothetical protein
MLAGTEGWSRAKTDRMWDSTLDLAKIEFFFEGRWPSP